MIHADETDEQAEDPAFVAAMLGKLIPYPDRADIIRRRVYTHHSRIAGAFRRGRLLVAGDAAHLMPVWQGQGTTAVSATRPTSAGNWRPWSTVGRARNCWTPTMSSAASTPGR